MFHLLLLVVVIFFSPFASATSCDDPNFYNVPNSIVAADIKDNSGRTERHWIIHRDKYCRTTKIEVLDSNAQPLGYVTYSYDDVGEHARTRQATVTVDTYAPDGAFLFRELMDGRTVDAAGNIISACALLKLIGHLEASSRKPYERRCHDAS